MTRTKRTRATILARWRNGSTRGHLDPAPELMDYLRQLPPQIVCDFATQQADEAFAQADAVVGTIDRNWERARAWLAAPTTATAAEEIYETNKCSIWGHHTCWHCLALRAALGSRLLGRKMVIKHYPPSHKEGLHWSRQRESGSANCKSCTVIASLGNKFSATVVASEPPDDLGRHRERHQWKRTSYNHYWVEAKTGEGSYLLDPDLCRATVNILEQAVQAIELLRGELARSALRSNENSYQNKMEARDTAMKRAASSTIKIINQQLLEIGDQHAMG